MKHIFKASCLLLAASTGFTATPITYTSNEVADNCSVFPVLESATFSTTPATSGTTYMFAHDAGDLGLKFLKLTPIGGQIQMRIVGTFTTHGRLSNKLDGIGTTFTNQSRGDVINISVLTADGTQYYVNTSVATTPTNDLEMTLTTPVNIGSGDNVSMKATSLGVGCKGVV